MRHNRTRRRIQRNFSHRKQMLENLVTSLFRHQQIQTTWVKAKEAQKLADRLITLGKVDSLYSRRKAYAILQDHGMTTELFGKIAPRFQTRKGGYTRVLHTGHRKGDAAPMAVLELTEKEIRERKIPAKKAKAGKGETHVHDETRHQDAPGERKAEKHKSEVPKEIKQKPCFLGNLKRFFRRKGGE